MASRTNNPSIIIEDKHTPGGSYVFPNDIYTVVNNRVAMTIHEYKRGAPLRPGQLGQQKWTIVLPLPNGLVENSSLNYDSVAMGALFGGVLSAKDVGDAAASGAATGVAKVVRSLVESGIKEIGSDSLAKKVSTAGQMAFNYAENPNLSLAFQGVNLREHNFQWTLMARSPEESRKIQEIISILRRAVLPRTYKGENFMFAYPYVFKLGFYPNDLIKFNDMGCFVTNMNVSYDTDGVPAFYKDTNQPVSVNLSMTFKERSVLTAEDYGSESVNIMSGTNS